MPGPENKTSIIPSGEAIAFVYQDSPNNNPVFKVKTGRIEDGTESLKALARTIKSIRGDIKFLTKSEIDERFGFESEFIRPFTEEEKKLLLS